MRILFTSLAPPYPATNGHRLRNWALLQALAEEGHELSLIAFAEPGEDTAASMPVLSSVCKSVVFVRLPHKSGKADYLGRIRSLARGIPFGVGRFESSEMA